MSTLKKILALTMAIAMVLSLNVFAAFKDQAEIDEDCVDAMEMMEDLGILTGDNGNAKPEAAITRAEVAAMIFRMMNKGNDSAKSFYVGMKMFDDVVEGSWYEGYVNYCASLGIVEGRTATMFVPNAPVTGYEVLKMLLVCLGYKSDAEGYTGANWTANVMSDAFEIDMMEDYGMAFSVPAQRQWVAFLFANALGQQTVKYEDGEAYVPAFAQDLQYQNTLGYKKFGLVTFTGILNSIGTATLTGSNAGEDKIYVGAKKLEADVDTALLGQEVDALVNAKKDDKVYSVRATGNNVVGDALLCDCDEDDDVYTIGEVEMELDGACIVVVNNEDCELADASAQLGQVGVNSTAAVKAIDNDDDEDIDVIIVTTSAYGEIDITKGNVKFDGTTIDKDKVEDEINFVNTVEDGDFVKVTANVFTGKYDIEAQEAKVGLLTRKNAGKFTVAGTVYEESVDAVSATDVDTFALSTKLEIYTDGKFIVAATEYEAAASTDMGTLVLLTAKGEKVTEDIYDGPAKTYMMKVLGLDNKVTEYEFDTDEDVATDFAALDKGTVYELIDNEDGTYALDDIADAYGDNKLEDEFDAGKLDISAGRMDNVRVGADVKMFMTYMDDDDTLYTVVTLASLKDDQEFVEGEAFYYYTEKNGIRTMVCGAFGGDFEAAKTVAVYAITTADSVKYYSEEDDEFYYDFSLIYATDPEKEVTLTSETDPSVVADQFVTIEEDNGEYTVEQCSYTELDGIVGIDATSVQFENGALTDVASDAIIVLETEDGLEFVTMADILAAYEDVEDEQKDYDFIAGCEIDSEDDEYTVLYFTTVEQVR